jgi:TetR/AcrR family transcriptional regulator, transcriptional repressor for nem operon
VVRDRGISHTAPYVVFSFPHTRWYVKRVLRKKDPPQDREAQKEATREALVEAGIAEMTKHGLEAPLDAICARAGFTRGAFYVHFRDRDDFVVAVMEHVLGKFLALVGAMSFEQGGIENAIRFFMSAADARDAAVHGGAQIRFHHLMEACRRSPKIKKRYGALVKDAQDRITAGTQRDQASKKLRRDVDAQKTTAVLTAIALGITSMIELDLPVNATEIGETLLALLAPKSR